MDRRAFSLSLLGLLASTALVRAEEAVFLDYTRDTLDNAYDQRVWAPDAQQIIARYARDSEEVRKRFPPRTERYGSREAETLDIFAPAGARALPVMVFIHGGAWRALGSKDASAPAPTFIENGCLYVALNFDNIPAVRLPEMVDQCRRAMVWIAGNIAAFGGDPGRIYLSGHSSGAHIAGVLLTTDWAAHGGAPDLVKGGLLMSGMYDLYPVMLSARSSYVKITPEELAALSAMRHLDQVRCDMIVVNGDRESPEFKRQSQVFASALAGMGRLTARLELAGKNHFEVPEALNDPASAVSKATLQMMKG